MHHYKKIKMHQPYINYSPLGTTFCAQLVNKEKIGSYDGFVTQIKGMAYITGVHQFLIENHDPFQKGYIV
ncbi:proline racemase family protein [Desulfobacula sp.]|uniref:proline racemase family protein n=1 Tax=Desulfobacula sp. TaxID=2593537 RepID=UPI00345B5CA1